MYTQTISGCLRFAVLNKTIHCLRLSKFTPLCSTLDCTDTPVEQDHRGGITVKAVASGLPKIPAY